MEKETNYYYLLIRKTGDGKSTITKILTGKKRDSNWFRIKILYSKCK